MWNFFHKSLNETPLPPDMKREIKSICCFECAETPELPRKPKLALRQEATPNVVVSLNAMKHKVQNIDIIVMIEHGNMMIRLKTLPNRTTKDACNTFYSRQIATNDNPMFVLVDRGYNIAEELMNEHFHQFDAQLCPIPTEVSWGIGLNDISNRYLYKSTDKLLPLSNYETGHDHEDAS